MNWYILVPFFVVVIVLIVFLIIKNSKDEKELEQGLNNDFPKTHDEHNSKTE